MVYFCRFYSFFFNKVKEILTVPEGDYGNSSNFYAAIDHKNMHRKI